MAIASVDPNSGLADLAIPIGISDIIDADTIGTWTRNRRCGHNANIDRV